MRLSCFCKVLFSNMIMFLLSPLLFIINEEVLSIHTPNYFIGKRYPVKNCRGWIWTWQTRKWKYSVATGACVKGKNHWMSVHICRDCLSWFSFSYFSVLLYILYAHKLLYLYREQKQKNDSRIRDLENKVKAKDGKLRSVLLKNQEAEMEVQDFYDKISDW